MYIYRRPEIDHSSSITVLIEEVVLVWATTLIKNGRCAQIRNHILHHQDQDTVEQIIHPTGNRKIFLCNKIRDKSIKMVL